MSLPGKYSATELQREFNDINNRLETLKSYLQMMALQAPPVNPSEGWVAISDGTGSGFDGSSGAGMYRYSGSAWVFIG